MGNEEKEILLTSQFGKEFRMDNWEQHREEIHSRGLEVYNAPTRREKAKQEYEKAQEAYEKSKEKQVYFCLCPECGLDTGEFEDGEFVDDEPPEFIHGRFAIQDQLTLKVTCPECGYEGERNEFESAWEGEHGKIRQPNVMPHPEPTASRLHRQAMDAAEMDSGRRF